MRMNINTFNRMLVFMPLVFSVLFELKKFKIWYQIIFLWDQGATPFQELLQLSPHSFRYFLMYPVIYISESIGVDRDFFFSLIILFIGFYAVSLLCASLKIMKGNHRRQIIPCLFISVVIVFLLFYMNGRGAIALCGFALLVNNIIKLEMGMTPNVWIFTNIFLALLLTSVSSGTLAVSFLTLSMYLLQQIKHILSGILRVRFFVERFKIFFVCLLFCIIFSSIIIVGFEKNLNFYGVGYEGFVNMLGHGIGAVLKPLLHSISMTSLIAIVCIIGIILNTIVQRFRYSLIVRILIICCGCGLFGYTTLSMAIVPLLILSTLYFPYVSASADRATHLRNAT